MINIGFVGYSTQSKEIPALDQSEIKIDAPRYKADNYKNAYSGRVKWSPLKSIWMFTMTFFGLIGAAFSFEKENLLIFLIITGFTICFGHSLGMHRLLIHRSFKTFRLFEYFLVWTGVLVGMAGPIGMMRTHDLRDWAQRQKKCHDFFAHRKHWLIDYWWQVHCDIELFNSPEFIPENQISNDRFYNFLEKTWMLQQLPLIIVLYWFGGMDWVIWGVCLRISISVSGHWLIGYFAHRSGQRSWHISDAGVQGYNIRFCGLLTMGECWHNNHHAFPGSAKLGMSNQQLDPGWLVLKVMNKIGLVWGIVTPEILPARKEVIELPINNY